MRVNTRSRVSRISKSKEYIVSEPANFEEVKRALKIERTSYIGG